MPSLTQRGCLLLLALPAAAFATPNTVTTHSTGTASVNPSVLYGMGLEYTSAEPEMPYELTLSTTFDWTGPLPAREEFVNQAPVQVVVDFRLGDFTWHYAGQEWSYAGLFTPYALGGDGYEHVVWANPNPGSYGYSFEFTHIFLGPAGSMGPGGALAPGVIEGAGTGGYLDARAFYSNDEYTFLFPMSGDVSTYSVEVTSPVPEPAAFATLAAGVLALGLRRRFARSAA